MTVLAALAILLTPRPGAADELRRKIEARALRLAELDEARAEYVEMFGIEPTPSELWQMTPPKGDDEQ